MNTEKISKIYDRLLEIKVEIDPVPSPDPQQLNTKIAQIHIFINEVEKHYIKVSKEISIIQRTLNDCTAEHESKKEDIISNNEEVRELPSIKDREARANQMIKGEKQKIKGYENELNDLNNLLRAINLKLKNLNRTNGDVRNQIRVMEAQIRLGVPPTNDAGTRTLQEELSRSLLNQDSFKNSEASINTEKIVDPSQPINTDEILEDYDDSGEDSEEDIPENYLDPLQEHGVEEDLEPADLDEQIIEEVKKSESEDQKINLDNIFGDQQKPETEEKGGEAESIPETKRTEEPKKTESPQTKGDINIDELLSQFS
jgi:hypothetical protein